jgi:signal peptidase
MKILKKAVTIVISIVLWLIILLAALYAFTTLATQDGTNVSNLAGFTPMIVETDSMAPTFNSGDLIFIRTCDPENLEEGDIITFHTIIDNEYVLNTHRIAEIKTEEGVRSYVTKGDNNEISDTHIIADGDIVGKYLGRIPNLGKIMDVLSSSAGFLIIIVLPMLLFFIYQVYHLIMVSINLKKAMALENAQKESANAENEDVLAKAEQAKAEAEADAMKARAEAEAALAEAKRLKAEAQAQLEQIERAKEDGDE